MRSMIKIFAVGAVALALSACLTSDGPLFDAKNARATPFADGTYDACQYEEDAAAPDCKAMRIEHDGSGLYRLAPEDEDEVTFARFKRASRGVYAAQLWGEDDDDPFYFLTTRNGAELTMSMIVCEDLPQAFRDRYSARGELVVEEGATTCVAKTAGAVVAAARAWLGTDARRTGSRLVYTRKAAP